jgi:comEA protein
LLDIRFRAPRGNVLASTARVPASVVPSTVPDLSLFVATAGTSLESTRGHVARRPGMRRVCLLITMVMAMAMTTTSQAAETAQDKAAKGKAEAAPSAPLNLNTATVAQLEALPGVGAATAKLIVEHRQKNGGFKKVEELMTIKGIGEKSFLKLKPMVTIVPEKAERQDRSADR